MARSGKSDLPTSTVLDAIRPENRVIEQEVSLQEDQGSIKSTLMREGCKHAGVDLDDPGTRKSWYHHRTGLLIIDLGENFAEVDDE